MIVCLAGFYERSPDLLEAAVAHIQLIIVTKWVLLLFQPCWWNMCHSFHHLFKNGWRFIATLLLNVVLGSLRRYIRTFLDMEWRNSSRTSAMFMPSTHFTNTWVTSWQLGPSHPSKEHWQTSSWASFTHRYAGLCFFYASSIIVTTKCKSVAGWWPATGASKCCCAGGRVQLHRPLPGISAGEVRRERVPGTVRGGVERPSERDGGARGVPRVPPPLAQAAAQALKTLILPATSRNSQSPWWWFSENPALPPLNGLNIGWNKQLSSLSKPRNIHVYLKWGSYQRYIRSIKRSGRLSVSTLLLSILRSVISRICIWTGACSWWSSISLMVSIHPVTKQRLRW